MAEYSLEVYEALCSLKKFKVNGVEADECDFVNNYDHAPEEAEDYACGDMQADILEPEDAVLKKYGIDEKEFREIAEAVSAEVSFGCCGWCV